MTEKITKADTDRLNDPKTQRILDDMKRDTELAERLVKENPGLPYITATIMAGDMRSADRAYERIKSGEWDVHRAINLTGSFARLDFAMRLRSENLLSREDLYAMLPDLWRGSDPDDTDPRWLELWRLAWLDRDARTIRDGKPLPRDRRLHIYRGQLEGAPVGIAWSLDPKIAQKFATGAGHRVPITGGVVLQGWVNRSYVYAYLTQRGESEVIVNPRYITSER